MRVCSFSEARAGPAAGTPRLRPSGPMAKLTTRTADLGLLHPLAISGIQAGGDQRARRLDPVKITGATELRAPCLLAPGHPAVNIGCGVYARVGSRARRQQCADDYCCKQSAFRFHHGFLPCKKCDWKQLRHPREGGNPVALRRHPREGGDPVPLETLDSRDPALAKAGAGMRAKPASAATPVIPLPRE
jgi:hypothetical protein